MSIPVSVVPQAIAALLSAVNTQVATDANASTIDVVQGAPGPDLPGDIIAIATEVRRSARIETFIGGGGTDWLNEDPEIICLVSCWNGDPDPTGVQARAYTLLGYIETAIRTDPSLGGLVDFAFPAETNDTGAQWTESPAGRLVEITVTVKLSKLN
jgi:hypothetical protein